MAGRVNVQKEELSWRNKKHRHMSVHGLRSAIGEEGEQEDDCETPGFVGWTGLHLQGRAGTSRIGRRPPRQRRTRWLVGSASVRKGSFHPAVTAASRAPTSPNTRATRKKNISTRERNQENWVANTGFKEDCGLPVVGLVPVRTWDGRPPVFWDGRPDALSLAALRGVLVRLLSGVGILRCCVAQATVVYVAAATR